jgi:hypothetical protein
VRTPFYAPWWINPIWAFWTIAIIVSALAISIPEVSYYEFWRVQKYIDGATILKFAMVSVAVAVGVTFSSVITGARRYVENGQDTWANREGIDRALRILFNVGFFLTLLGYSIWFLIAVFRGLGPDTLLGVFSGQGGAIYSLKREYFETVPGVTTLTQFGTATTIVGLLALSKGLVNLKWKLAIIVALAVLRSYFLSERLAMLEILIPACVLAIRMPEFRAKFRLLESPFVLATLPFLAITSVMTIFIGFEYFRSWISFYSMNNSSLLEFGLTRFAGYYATAVNNSSLLLQNIDWPLPLPYYTVEWFWKLPLLNSVFDYEELTGIPLSRVYSGILTSYANAEFNNPGGLVLPIIDYGLVGGLLFWLIVGIVIGVLYDSFLNGRMAGLMLYPVLYLGILECPRILYWFNGRTFPTWILLIAGYFFLSSASRVEVKALSINADVEHDNNRGLVDK